MRDTLRISRCRKCGERVIWTINPENGHQNLLNADRVPGRGNIDIIGDAGGMPEIGMVGNGRGDYVSHFGTCRKGSK